MPNDDQISNASNGVPAPFLGSAFSAESSEEAGQDHDKICDDGKYDVAAIEAGNEGEVKEQEGSSQAPVDVSGPVHLALDDLLGVGDMLVGAGNDDLVVGDAVAGSHGEV